MDIRQSPRFARHLSNLGWTVEKVGDVYCYIKFIPILGAFVKVQRPEILDLEAIESLRKKYRIFQFIVEPKNKEQASKLKGRGYRLSKHPYLPTKTLLLKLDNQKSMLNRFRKDTRYAVKKTLDLKVFHNPPIRDFHTSWKNSLKFSQYVPSVSSLESLLGTFKKDMLILASHNNMSKKYQYSAGTIFLRKGIKLYYWHAFTGKVGRSTLAQSGLIWKGILWGMSKGAKLLDFEGVYDSRFPNRSWLGFSHFKKGFGGEIKTYPGTFIKYFVPIKV